MVKILFIGHTFAPGDTLNACVIFSPSWDPCKILYYFRFSISFISIQQFLLYPVVFYFHPQQWTDDLLKMANNLLALNGSVHYFLRKAHIRLTLQADKGGKIAVKK